VSAEEDMMDDQVKDKGKGRDFGNIEEGSDGESENGDEDDGEDEGGDDGEDEGEDDGENSGKEKVKESDEDVGKVKDAGGAKGAGDDQDVEMADINKVETRVATAVMANTIEVTTSAGE
jgi:hypothetical protein